MTAASNSEARKRAAGFPASSPTDPEPTGTLEGAPGADSEVLAALLGLHRRPAEALTVFGEAWMVCGCGERIDIPVRDAQVNQREVLELHDAHAAAAVLASSWLADHDRQIAERAWEEGAQAEYDLDRGHIDDFSNPYSEEAHRG